MAGKIVVALALSALVICLRANTARSRNLRARGDAVRVYGEATGLAVWVFMGTLVVLGVMGG